jgi:hypothetical protein
LKIIFGVRAGYSNECAGGIFAEGDMKGLKMIDLLIAFTPKTAARFIFRAH